MKINNAGKLFHMFHPLKTLKYPIKLCLIVKFFASSLEIWKEMYSIVVLKLSEACHILFIHSNIFIIVIKSCI